MKENDGKGKQMPLHDWSLIRDWETMHLYWITELGRWLKARLPTGFRASLATVPSLVVAPVPVHPDVSVHRQPVPAEPAESLAGDLLDVAPDEKVTLALAEAERAV